jgi:hypothetical protein
MRAITLTILIVVISPITFCQNIISSVIKHNEILTPYYELKAAGGKVLYLPMDYSRSTFSYNQKDAIKGLQDAIIVRIDLVYTDYPAKTDFSPLTKKRLEALQKELPQVFLDKNIEFRKIRQTIATSRESAAGLPHGFYIYFRPMPTKSSGKEEVKKLKSSLAVTSLITSLEDTTDITWCSQSTFSADTNASSLPVLPDGYKRTISKMSIKEAISRELISKEDEKTFRELGDPLFYIEDKREEGCDGEDYFLYEMVDSTVTRVLKRQNWKHSFIIADVTGSMYPYIGQLLKWLQLNLTDKQKRHFVFFNDGDNKDDDKKIIGKTGGLYPVFTNQYDEVERTIIKAMENGGGGDAPENNMEALLESDSICKSCDSIVMIADNWAPIKDIALLASYRKPVKIVLCGVFNKINKDYLKLARDTKGSIHLMEEDIYTLSELKEGETIKIHGVTYKLIEGNFIDVTPKLL